MLPPNPTTAPRGGGVWREDLSLERIAALIGAAKEGTSGSSWGDDAAELAAPVGRLVVCTDAGVAGVHLETDLFPLGDLGYRTVVAALSDLAAMGAAPLGVVVAICAPGDVDVVAIARDTIDAASAHDCRVVGGDLSRSATTTTTVSAVGDAREGRVVLRSGASVGDHVFVTGPVGGAAAGLRRRRAGSPLDDPVVRCHRRPVARLAHGAAAARAEATAMIDVSDGVARDVRRLAAASKVDVALFDLPLVDGATLEEGLGGGEDYELVLTHAEPDELERAFAGAGLSVPLRIGTVTAGSGTVTYDGEALGDLGWQH